MKNPMTPAGIEPVTFQSVAQHLTVVPHVRYVWTNNPMSAYALHMLNNKHEYGNASETLELLKPCHKGTRMNCWETFYIQAFHQHKTLITE